MRKKRILIANDYSGLGTGYGVYGKELLTRLYATGKYEIAEIACYATEDMKEQFKKFPWKIYPNSPCKHEKEETIQKFQSNHSNSFGSWRFHLVCPHFKPDIVFDMRDYWMYTFEEVCLYRPFYKWVVMPTVDSAPQKSEWLSTFRNMDLVIPYTEWAKKTLEEQCGSSINLFPEIVNAGVDINAFVPPENKKELQKSVFGKEVEITGCVMRNQKRKLIPDMLKAYRKYLDLLLEKGDIEKYNKSYLYMHTSYPETGGWDIPSLLLEHNMQNKTYFTTLCLACKSAIVTKFHQSICSCTKCGAPAGHLPNAGSVTVSTPDLVRTYQLFDLFVQPAICEGFGMPQVEAASCGIPIASTNYSAMTEIVKKLEGYPIKVDHLFREMETGADRANISVESLVDILMTHHYLSEEEKIKKSQKTRELCCKHYSWDVVASVWDKALSSVDISTNIPWDAPARPIDTSKKVPANISPIGLVKFIIEEIIKEPYLLQTSPIITMMQNLVDGYIINGKAMAPATHQKAIESLQTLLQQKVKLEEVRVNIDNIKETFLDV